MSVNVAEVFGQDVFNEAVMKERLPEVTYKQMVKLMNEGGEVTLELADIVAKAMKEWAIEKGATHYTHIFQPYIVSIGAEKHDSFADIPKGGKIENCFSGKDLMMGEPDASSFPSGGLRATFEARGYTAWDPTSYAFIKGHTLCIPTAFCSYSGEALDKKTPLLRSMQALNKQALRVLKLFGNEDVKCVHPCVGPEQEYFLIDKAMYEKRKDLVFCGRTLFGAKPPKGQELDDHYFGAIKPRVEAYMEELNTELWKLGIYAKTEHNEVAPSQHELASIYTVANVATDQNQLIMEIMQRVASRHDLVCLLAEKPFAGVNGSGKHNNWSLATDTGVNLFKPGETPYENAQFLLFLCAAVQAVDNYQNLLRLSVATAGNDHRLGANEAPPAVISIFLGDELTAVLDAIETDTPYSGTEKTVLKLGVHVLPKFTRDTTDRNRTSPFAFTGNKFEFRMVGSSDSIACANIMLNAAMAETLKEFSDRLEGVSDFESALHDLIKETIKAHKRIIFNGNGYDDAWIKEATEKRGLLNLRTTPDALATVLEKKNVEMLTSLKIFSEAEIRSRYEICLENYCKTVNIEGLTMVDMARKEILPAVEAYLGDLSGTVAAKTAAVPGLACKYEKDLISKLSKLADEISDAASSLDTTLIRLKAIPDVTDAAYVIRDVVLQKMAELRVVCDEAESITADKYWPFPTYGDLLFGVR